MSEQASDRDTINQAVDRIMRVIKEQRTFIYQQFLELDDLQVMREADSFKMKALRLESLYRLCDDLDNGRAAYLNEVISSNRMRELALASMQAFFYILDPASGVDTISQTILDMKEIFQ